MDQKFVQRMKEKLLQMKTEILENLAQESAEFNEIVASGDQKDIVDIASTDIDKNVLSTLGNQEMKSLRLIESALSRIENGVYGTCLKTGKPIPKERLEAIPYALYTIDYQNELERRNR
jgi:RNA polymerase-binding protein DksA